MIMKRTKRKTKIGKVISDKMDKTVVVEVERFFVYPMLEKRIKRTNRFKAHNSENKARLGDKVKIAETRPLSKDKHWRVVEILAKGSDR